MGSFFQVNKCRGMKERQKERKTNGYMEKGEKERDR